MSIVIFISDSYCIRHCWVSFFLFNKLLGGDKKKKKNFFWGRTFWRQQQQQQAGKIKKKKNFALIIKNKNFSDNTIFKSWFSFF